MLGGARSIPAVGVIALMTAAVAIAGCGSPGDEAADSIDTTATPSTTSPVPTLATDPLESPDTATYVVVAGDSLSAIAGAAGVSLDALVAANRWSDGAAHVIHPGDVIVLPPGATQPEPREAPTATDPPGSDGPTSVAGVGEGGYRAVDPAALLDLGDDGVSDSIDGPLADGIYYAGTYELTADHTGVRFDLARFYTTEACIATLDTVPVGTVDESGCYGGLVDTSVTATVTLRLDDEVPVILYSFEDNEYLEVTAEEFARLLSGQPPAADAPASFEFLRLEAIVEVADGTVVRANQRFGS